MIIGTLPDGKLLEKIHFFDGFDLVIDNASVIYVRGLPLFGDKTLR